VATASGRATGASFGPSSKILPATWKRSTTIVWDWSCALRKNPSGGSSSSMARKFVANGLPVTATVLGEKSLPGSDR
jgi:hypothetical protein